ncbi:MAG: DUF1800 domain-containing protein [Planctomycetota bacterium]|jgi:uncharacterized protein (DUF1800 family)
MNRSRRKFVQLLGASGAAALAGCDAATDALVKLLDPDAGVDFRPPDSGEIDPVTHVLNRISWGPRPGDYARVAAMGVGAYIDEQLDPASIPDRHCDRRTASIESPHEPTAELYEHHPRELLADLTRQKLLRGVLSRRQLYEIMVDFWSDHLNIASGKGDCKWLKVADERDVIRKHAMGSFPALIRASAVSPAMLIYLDGHDNKVVHPGDRPNENYARELLELHTLGVDGGYTQGDVMEVARCLSGWTYENRPFKFRAATVDFDANRHDRGEKTVLGHRIPADGGAEELDRIIEIVCGHPSTARNIAVKLCRRFIADPPPADAVATVAAAFSRSQGNIPETLQSLFHADAFRSSRGRVLKRPLRYVVSTLRATDARTNAGPPVMHALERMGHAPFQYPSPDGYPLESEPWLGTLLWRWNFALGLEHGRLEGTSVNKASLVERLGGLERTAAHLLGRRLNDLELSVLEGSGSPLALMLAGPAFQWH